MNRPLPENPTRMRVRRGSVAAVLTVACGLLVVTPSAHAVKTEQWKIGTYTEFTSGEREALKVSNAGELRLGHSVTNIGDFAKEIWCSLNGADGAVYFGTGSRADVYVLTGERRAVRLLETDAIAVTALARDSAGNIYAATMADGRVYKIPANQGATRIEAAESVLFCKLSVNYIWALVLDQNDQLFAATGPGGQIMKIDAQGNAEPWYTVDESSVVSLAFSADGTLYAGGGDRGLLYRITGKDEGRVIHAFEEDEVKVLIADGDELLIGVNAQKSKRGDRAVSAQRNARAFAQSTRQVMARFGGEVELDAGAGKNAIQQALRGNRLNGAVYRMHADGRFDRLAKWGTESILNMALSEDGSVLVATAGDGRVYRLIDSTRWDVVLDLDEKYAMTMALRDGSLYFVGTGSIGKVYLVDLEPVTHGDYISEVRDCRFSTTWGNIGWEGNGPVEVSTRTGNTRLPDDTWSEWSEPQPDRTARISSPAARFIQARARLGGEKALLDSLRAYYLIQNQKPEVQSVTIGDPAPVNGNGTSDDGNDDDAADTPADKSKITAGSAGVPGASNRAVPKHAPTQKVRWRASDSDGDTLVARLYYQRDGDDVWVPLALDKPVTGSDYQWDTESVPDGWYRLKVAASDETSNAAGRELIGERISDRILVDNRKPVIGNLAYDAATARVSGLAEDASSRILWLEYTVDGGEWEYTVPDDDVFDARSEPFSIELEDLDVGVHAVAVRAVDEAGNAGVEQITIRVQP
jgi:outer membrane protein assembly factor BamB